MKLTDDLKKKIIDYFEDITAKDLFEKAIVKYGFEEDFEMDFHDRSFMKGRDSVYKGYKGITEIRIENAGENNFALAA